MAAASYIPGGWLGVIRSGTAVILDPATPAPLVSTVWELLAKSPDAAEVLHAVTGGFGAPLSASPWFGIIGFSDSLRVFLRGDIDLTVQLPSGPVNLDGRNVTTWTERWLDAPEWFSVKVPAAAQAHPEGRAAALHTAELPVVEGTVLLQSLRVSVTGSGGTPSGRLETAATPAAAPAPAAPSTPATPAEASAETIAAPGEDISLAAEPEQEASAETVAGLQETVTGFTETGAAGARTLPEDSPATELTGSYDHLWDKTVVRSIEDAAVRTDQENDGGAPAGGEVAVPETGTKETAAQESVSAQSPSATDPSTQSPSAPDPSTPAPSAPAPATPALSGLIDSVPWATGGDRAPASEVPPAFSAPPVPPTSAAAEAPPSFSAPGVQPSPTGAQMPPSFAAAQVPPSFISVPGAGGAAEGDHDGQTILKSDLPTSGAGNPGQGPEPGQAAAAGNGPLVLARVCPAGHANPPTSGQCFTCGAQLPDVAIQVPRPRLGRLRLSTGELLDLDESLVIGRQPSVSRVQGGTMPRLVQVASPGGDISRSHVEVRLEGWHVMLCDLKATNGTVLVREGQPPRRLAQNEMAIVLDGDIAELGDDVSLRFEEIL
ncbi:hypothetical protein R5O87_10100 [Arthrobacter globiformis]|uniref:hypothetical protein n=1 Tax=Arthrobacter globiformis TaxID=1665 RepID=UPI00397C79BF